mgnify:CR=1 FL=1|jgi:hypothetical protein
MLNKIKLYIGYWLIMLSFYSYRKIFVWDWFTLKETFKVISHPNDYDSATVAESYVRFICTNVELHEKVELLKRYGL